jgi:hypothetical protein
MKKLVTTFVSVLFVLLSCKNESIVADFKPPLSETVAVYSTSDQSAEINVELSNVRANVAEVGAVWSEKPSPTIADQKQSYKNLKQDQTVLLRMDELKIGKKYYVRSFIANGKEIVYGSELVLNQQFTNEWRKNFSLSLLSNEYILPDEAYYDRSGGLLFNRIDKKTNFTTKAVLFPQDAGWNPNFLSDRKPEVEQMRFNQIRATFDAGAGAWLTLIGAGHYKIAKGERVYLADLKLLGSTGYKWTPDFPGAEAETSSFAIGSYAYVLENLAQGHLWRFELSDVVKWTDLGPIPFKGKARFLAKNNTNKAIVIVEPLLWDNAPVAVYSYIPEKNQWIQLADFPAENRRRGTIFKIDGRVFYGLGQSVKTKNGLRDIWELKDNQWLKATTYPGSGTINMVAVPYYDGALIGFGQQVSINALNIESIKDMSDFWFFKPQE